MEINNIERLTHAGSEFVFTRMQNIIWVTSGLGLSYIIEKDAGDLLGQIIKTYQREKPLIVNFARINDIDDHALDGFFESLTGNKRQVIIVEGTHLYNRIDLLRKNKPTKIFLDPEIGIIVLGNQDKVNVDKIEGERITLTNAFKEKCIKNCFKKFTQPERLSSTPLIANGEFDSNELISDSKSFLWITTFLADQLIEVIEDNRIENPKLISVSLRAAPFVAALGMMMNIPYDTIDHLGPKHKVLDNDFLNRFTKKTNYIFIGDFCIGGTEIKIAKTFLELNGSYLNHAIVIGNYIESQYFIEYFKLYSLVDLKKLELVSYTV